MSELSPEQLTRLNSLMDSFYNERNDSVLSEVFQLFDRNNNGRLEAAELQTVMSQVSGERVPESEIRDMINEADANKNGVIELNEFINIMKKHRD
jgi:calmodulin